MVEPNHENSKCKNIAVMIILVCCSAGILEGGVVSPTMVLPYVGTAWI
jgi:hypothetical protein